MNITLPRKSSAAPMYRSDIEVDPIVLRLIKPDKQPAACPLSVLTMSTAHVVGAAVGSPARAGVGA